MMRSKTWRILAVLALVGLMGCQSSGRAMSPWRVQRVPAWPPPLTNTAPRSASPFVSPWPRSESAQIGKPVPIPTPDPLRKGGASLSNEINVLVVGVLLVFFVVAAPDGVIGLFRKFTKKK